MKLISKLSCDDYLCALRKSFGRFWDFHQERFVGFIAGRVFFVFYHAKSYPDRRIVGKDSGFPKKRYNAFGYVKNNDYGSEISYLCTTDCSDPISLIVFFVVGLLGSLKDGFLFSEPGVSILIALFVSVFAVSASAIFGRISPVRQEGTGVLSALLKDPSCYRSLLK